MGNIIKLRQAHKNKNDEDVDFAEVLDALKRMHVSGKLGKAFILVNGKSLKYCASNHILIDDAVDMCKDFIRNTEEYLS